MNDTTPAPDSYEADIIIVGGGIAGLWSLNRLRTAGFNAILLEIDALGAGQTIASQGIIHGGLKYALQGLLSPSAKAIASQPKRWKECLEGQGELDLRKVTVLAPHHYLWTMSRLSSKIASFFASRALASPAHKIPRKLFPSLLQQPKFSGEVYQLDEIILDVPSLLQNLSAPVHKFIFKIEALETHLTAQKEIDRLTVNIGQSWVNLKAQRYLFTAGSHNPQCLEDHSDALLMQQRPLHMVMLAHCYPAFYGHCVEANMNPRLTFSSHPLDDTTQVAYLGGNLAEAGVGLDCEQQIEAAKKELFELLPGIDWHQARYKTLEINRAELNQKGARPSLPSVVIRGRAIIAWPTKLAMTPLLVDNIEDALQGLKPGALKPLWPEDWPHPTVAIPPWVKAFS